MSSPAAPETRTGRIHVSYDSAAEVASWHGFCPICRQQTRFVAKQSWFRDHLICQTCPNGSIPRERALMKVLEDLAPGWRHAAVHESSPTPRGVSLVLARECAGYLPTQFFPGVEPGRYHGAVQCQNLENQTFDDGRFDVVITQDVMEHVFHPDRAFQEIARTLKPDGIHILTTPIYKDRTETRICARLLTDGRIEHLEPPEYHGNPVDQCGSLVTIKYGYDVADLIDQWADMDVEIRRFRDKTHGIVAEFTEVIVCRRRAARNAFSDNTLPSR
jgi:SAM-dependent methyltransferase